METAVLANDPTAVVIYSKRIFAHAIRSTVAAKLMAMGLSASSEQNFVQLFDEPSKGPGAEIKYDIIPNPVGPGVQGDNPIAGSEVGLGWLQDSFTIDQQRQAILVKGRMSQQRVPYSLRDAAKVGLANWWKEIIDYGLLNQLGGNTAQTNVLYTGLNAAVAPDSSHHMYAGNQSAESGLTSSHVFDISIIPALVAKAQSQLAFPIRPVMVKGVQVDGLLFLHPLQVKALKTNFSAGGWAQVQQLAYQGLGTTGNPIFNGAVGMIDNVVIHQDAHVPYGDSDQNQIFDPVQKIMVAAPSNLGAAATGTTSVARGIFVGAQAAAIAFGGADNVGDKSLKVKWYEELLDAGNQLRVTSGMMYGIHKTRFNSQDFATIVVSSWAE
jgi:N4-gp56 family major capsid protein